MRRRILLVATISIMMLVTLRHSAIRRGWRAEQTAQRHRCAAPASLAWQNPSELYLAGQKKKTVGKITDKDIAKFESSEVSRVNDATTPTVAPATPASTRPLTRAVLRTHPKRSRTVKCRSTKRRD
jgi:hypothetical protein